MHEACVELLSTRSEVKVVAVKAVGDDAAAVARAKDTTDALLAGRKNIEKAQIPFEMALSALLAEVDTAAKGITVSLGVKGRPIIRWPTEMLAGAEPYMGVIPTVVPPQALLAAYAHDALVADVEKQLRVLYEKLPLTLTPAEKAKRLKKADDDILAAQRVEAATIWAARAAGVPADWRPDIDPRAVLGVETNAP